MLNYVLFYYGDVTVTRPLFSDLITKGNNSLNTIYRTLYAFFWVIRRSLNFICRRFGTLCLFHLHRQVGPFYTHLPAYEDGTECSETPEYKIQTPGNHPKESIQYPKVIIPSPTVRTVTVSYGPHQNGDGLPSRRPLDVLTNNTRTTLQILVQRRWI